MDPDIEPDGHLVERTTTTTQTPVRDTDSGDLNIFSPVNIEALKQESQAFTSSSSVQGAVRYTRPVDENTSLLSAFSSSRRSYSYGETEGGGANASVDADADADAEANLYSVYQDDIINHRRLTVADIADIHDRLVSSKIIETTVEATKNFISGVFNPQEDIPEGGEFRASMQDVVRQFGLAIHSVGTAVLEFCSEWGARIYDVLQSTANSTLEFVKEWFTIIWEFLHSLYHVFFEFLKGLDKQGWVNAVVSSVIILLVAHSISASMQQQSHNLKMEMKIITMNSEIESLRHALQYLQNNSSSSALIDLKLNSLENSMSDQIQFTESTVLDTVKNVADNLNETIQASTSNLQSQLVHFHEDSKDQGDRLAESILYTRQNTTIELQSIKHSVSSALSTVGILGGEVDQKITEVRAVINSTISTIGGFMDEANKELSDTVQKFDEEMNQYKYQTNNEFSAESNFVKFQLAGTFVVLACLCSGWHLTNHRSRIMNLEAQKRVMAILWMVPVYAVTSWVSLVWPDAASVMGAFRDCYEAYAIYMFVALLATVMEGDRGLPALITRLASQVKEEMEAEEKALIENKPLPSRHLTPPLPCGYSSSKEMSIAATWIYQCKLLALQFCLVQPTLGLLPFVLNICGISTAAPDFDDKGAVDWGSYDLWSEIIQNVSICFALWGLWCFYHGTIKELEWMNPLPKFLCIKGVVFMTYYQAIVIDILSYMGSFSSTTAASYQNLLICIEMFLFSVFHVYVFPLQEWEKDYKTIREEAEKTRQRVGFRDTLAVNEFFSDFKSIVTVQDYFEGVENDEDEEELFSQEKNGEETISCFFPGKSRDIVVGLGTINSHRLMRNRSGSGGESQSGDDASSVPSSVDRRGGDDVESGSARKNRSSSRQIYRGGGVSNSSGICDFLSFTSPQQNNDKWWDVAHEYEDYSPSFVEGSTSSVQGAEVHNTTASVVKSTSKNVDGDVSRVVVVNEEFD